MSKLNAKLLPLTANQNSNGALEIGGVNISELIAEVGSPAYIYDVAELKQRLSTTRTHFGSNAAYASKAFQCVAMSKLAHESGLMIDVASAGEAYIALCGGVPADRLVFHGNNKSLSALKYAIDNGFGVIVIDSLDELDRIEALCDNSSKSVNVMVRVSPGIEADTHHKIKTGHFDSKFGIAIDSEELECALNRVQGMPQLNLVGLHCHLGSQIFDLDVYREAIRLVGPLTDKLGLKKLVIGGGIGVPYTNEDPETSIEQWAEVVNTSARDFGISAAISTEPGRFISARAGITVYRVGTIKTMVDGREYLAINGGLADNPRHSLYQAKYEPFLIDSVFAERERTFKVVGQHCETDVFIESAELPISTSVGDLIGIPVTGAYCHVMASNYNAFLRPPVVFCSDGRFEIVVRRETFDDLVVRDTVIR